jgi:hypothetical protein
MIDGPEEYLATFLALHAIGSKGREGDGQCDDREENVSGYFSACAGPS